jgi:predicted GIY-YIG superfamily endonuclease
VFSTKLKKPYKIVHYEAFLNKKDAFIREKWLKTGWGRNQIKVMLENYFEG